MNLSLNLWSGFISPMLSVCCEMFAVIIRLLSDLDVYCTACGRGCLILYFLICKKSVLFVCRGNRDLEGFHLTEYTILDSTRIPLAAPHVLTFGARILF